MYNRFPSRFSPTFNITEWCARKSVGLVPPSPFFVFAAVFPLQSPVVEAPASLCACSDLISPRVLQTCGTRRPAEHVILSASSLFLFLFTLCCDENRFEARPFFGRQARPPLTCLLVTNFLFVGTNHLELVWSIFSSSTLYYTFECVLVFFVVAVVGGASVRRLFWSTLDTFWMLVGRTRTYARVSTFLLWML